MLMHFGSYTFDFNSLVLVITIPACIPMVPYNYPSTHADRFFFFFKLNSHSYFINIGQEIMPLSFNRRVNPEVPEVR